MRKFIKKTFLFSSVLIIIFSIWVLLKFVQLQTVSDISLEHVNQKKNPMVYAISYADGESVYFKNQNFWAMSTINKGVDCIFLYNKNHIDEDFYLSLIHI